MQRDSSKAGSSGAIEADDGNHCYRPINLFEEDSLLDVMLGKALHVYPVKNVAQCKECKAERSPHQTPLSIMLACLAACVASKVEEFTKMLKLPRGEPIIHEPLLLDAGDDRADC